jgi:hypothetical protein
MAHYRLYILGQDDRIIQPIDLDCANDRAAIESAKQFGGNSHDVELWQRDRMVTKLAKSAAE